MVNPRKYIHRKIRIINTIGKINQLEIQDAGLDSESGFPYIHLKNGPIFYGIFPPKNLRKYYWFFSWELRNKVPQECLRVAMDIIIRYQECGLKWGGPKKERFYDIQPGDVVAEMGAYMGYYCLRLSEKVGKTGQVIAIEPIPENIAILRKNISDNNLSNVQIVPKGVWRQKDQLPFQQRSTDNQSGSVYLQYDENENHLLEVDSLDNILAASEVPNVNFMVIQLNGAELEALQGLTQFRPEHLAIAVRYGADTQSDIPEITVLLQKRGYQVKVVEKKFVFAQHEQA